MLDEIANKINQLKTLDKYFKVFGADAHHYNFRQNIDKEEVINFEQGHNISLPEDYRNFILRFGNGGCGPGYGLLKLENGIYDLPTNRTQSEIITLSNSFRFSKYWNFEEHSNDSEEWEEEYDNIKWTDGMLRICHLGSAAYLNLVITGKERGNVWIDDRSSEGGIYPNNHYSKKEKYDFLSWYSDWLDNSINQFRNL